MYIVLILLLLLIFAGAFAAQMSGCVIFEMPTFGLDTRMQLMG